MYWNVYRYYRIGTNLCMFTNHDPTQYFGTRTHIHVPMQYGGFRPSPCTQLHLLKNQAIGSNSGR